jgi:hypothetical protein
MLISLFWGGGRWVGGTNSLLWGRGWTRTGERRVTNSYVGNSCLEMGKNYLRRGVKNYKRSNPHLCMSKGIIICNKWGGGDSPLVCVGFGKTECVGMAIKKLFKFWEPHIIHTVCMGNCLIIIMSLLSRKQNKKFVLDIFSSSIICRQM